jgi:hypothetical protein
MLINEVRKEIRAELESPAQKRRVGTGWLSGVGALVAALAGLFLVLCLRYPDLLTLPPLRTVYLRPAFRLGLHFLLIGTFFLSILSLVLRSNRVLGFTAITITLLATILGGSRVRAQGELVSGIFLGLDWFVLNVLFTGFLFIPIERLFPRCRGQALFRDGWREDLFYYLVSSLLVQVLTFLSMAPALAIQTHTHWTSFRHWVGAQPVVLQLIAIMFPHRRGAIFRSPHVSSRAVLVALSRCASLGQDNGLDGRSADAFPGDHCVARNDGHSHVHPRL